MNQLIKKSFSEGFLYKSFSNTYCIVEKNFCKESNKHFEGVFAQGSGYLQIRGSFEEGLNSAPQDEEYLRMPANVTIEKPKHPFSKWGVFIPGITGNHPLLNEEIINLPYLLAANFYLDGEKVDMENNNISNYVRFLDMRDGVLYRRFNVSSKNSELSFEMRRFVSKDDTNLVCQEFLFKCEKGSCDLKIENDINCNVRTNGYSHFSKTEKTTNDIISTKILTDNNEDIWFSSALINNKNDSVKNAFEFSLKSGETMSFTKLSLACTSRDNLFPLNERLYSIIKNKEQIYPLHSKEWERLWLDSKVEIEGDLEAQKAINFSIYHMLRAISNDSRVAICAKGYAGEAYFGRFFWDTEIYLLPFFLYSHPDLAYNLIKFRINTLNGAKENAKKYGYSGARYPWESSISGDEQCPNWQYADHEVHVTADIVFAIWHYYSATRDKNILLEAKDVFIQTALYWCDRVEFKDDDININGVMGPDEYTCFCNNNVFTNFMVAKSLSYSLKAFVIIDCLDELEEDFIYKIKYISDSLIEKIDFDKNIIFQCDHFESFEELDFDKIWTDRSLPFGKFISQERNYRSKSLKQPDLLMLPYLYPSYFSEEKLKSNYDYYLKYTTHDSSLSMIIHSILSNQLKDKTQALDMFYKACKIDLDEKKLGAAAGIHIANCGGIWQSVIYGFAGMKPAYESDKPSFSPNLPDHWSKLSFNISFKGEKYHIEIVENDVKITAL